MSDPKKYTFGPVPSRRLGRSLGVDLVPLKTCTQNCIYCQLGVHGERVTQRMPYVDVAVVLKELKEQVDAGLNADYINIFLETVKKEGLGEEEEITIPIKKMRFILNVNQYFV